MLVIEKYKRPCFAACAKCGEHGVIVFMDGDQSEPIISIEDDKKILKTLTATGKLSYDDADRIEDQLICSDLMDTNEQSLALGFLSLLISTLESGAKSTCPHPEWN